MMTMMTVKMMTRTWDDDAACKGYPDLPWFPPDKDELEGTHWQPFLYGIARDVCAICPVRKECLVYALKNKIIHGMWGGLTPDERKNYDDGTS
jgi:WhiB family transcriptional regulator, redox-sensing transcriptional regulator